MLPVWMVLKVRQFDNRVFVVDVYGHVQMCVGWLKGYPLLFESGYGLHDRLHNYYLNPLLAPLVWENGAYGLFAVNVALLGAALVVVQRLVRQAGAGRAPVLLLVSFGLVGPVSLWLFFDLTFGWHVEPMYVPLAVLWVAALLRQARWPLVVVSIAWLLAKENAIVVLACLLLLAQALHGLAEAPQRSFVRVLLTGRAARTVAWALAVFGLGLFFLSYKNHFQGGRLGEAVRHVVQTYDPWVLGKFLAKAGGFALLLPLTLVLPMMGLLQYPLRLRWRIGGLLGLFYLPVFGCCLAEGLLYYPTAHQAAAVVPRASLLWSYAVAAVLLAGAYFPRWRLSRPGWRSVLVLFVGLASQEVVLESLAKNGQRFVQRFVWPYLHPLPPDDASTTYLRQLGKRLPVWSSAVCPDDDFALFHRQFAWSFTNRQPVRPDALIFDRKTRAYFTQQRVQGYVCLRCDSVWVFVRPALASVMKPAETNH